MYQSKSLFLPSRTHNGVPSPLFGIVPLFGSVYFEQVHHALQLFDRQKDSPCPTVCLRQQYAHVLYHRVDKNVCKDDIAEAQCGMLRGVNEDSIYELSRNEIAENYHHRHIPKKWGQAKCSP